LITVGPGHRRAAGGDGLASQPLDLASPTSVRHIGKYQQTLLVKAVKSVIQ